MEKDEKIMGIREIKKYLPHRYPFLFLDRITNITENGLTAIKNVTGNEYFFEGHFPGYPVMPGVLQIEALAQASALFVIYKYNLKNSPVYFMSIDKVKFRGQVIPGDVLQLRVELKRFGGKVAKVSGKGLVGEKSVVEAEMMAMIETDVDTAADQQAL